jgi:hypothetical protein
MKLATSETFTAKNHHETDAEYWDEVETLDEILGNWEQLDGCTIFRYIGGEYVRRGWKEPMHNAADLFNALNDRTEITARGELFRNPFGVNFLRLDTSSHDGAASFFLIPGTAILDEWDEVDDIEPATDIGLAIALETFYNN